MITMGQAPPGSSYNDQAIGYPLIAGAGDFGSLDLPEAKRYTSNPTKICKAGDIVLSIRATIGTKVLSDRDYCLGRGVAGLRATEKLHERYLWHWLTYAESDLYKKGKGAIFPQVSRRDITELTIPLPGFSEQRRIAKILDKVDMLRRKRERTLILVHGLSYSIFIKMFGSSLPPLSNDDNSKPLSYYATFLSGAGFPLDFQGIDTQEIPFYKVSDMNKEENDIFMNASNNFVSSEIARMLGAKIHPAQTIIFPKIGAAISTNKKRILTVPSCFDNNVIGMRFVKNRSDPYFLYTWINLQNISTFAQPGNPPSIRKSTLENVRVKFPMLESQKIFGAVLRSQWDTLKYLQRSCFSMDNMFASLQHRAFTGQL